MVFRRAFVPLVVVLATRSAGAQDFDPHGRRHPRPALPPPHANAPGPGADESQSPGSRSSPTPATLIDRYTRAVLSQPGAPFPLQRLAKLYRDRDGDVARLAADFAARAEKPGADQYAAVVALAGIAKLDGRTEEAILAYERAIALKSDDASARLALGRLEEDRGNGSAARAWYETALPLQPARADKEQTLRALIVLALDAKDWAAAKTFHRSLLALEPTSLFVRSELARELSNRGEYERAEVELKDVVAAAAGDNRALAPALKELGSAQAKAHEKVAALATLKRALSAAGAETALRAEIYEVVAAIYRADQQLPTLVKELEDEHPNDPARLALLGGLYEETGDQAKAVATYRRALAQNPRQIDIRLRVIRLLQSSGDLDKAIVEYETLIRAAPDHAQFVFEECETLMQRGDRARALKLVTDLEARAAGDEEVLSRVADFYARIGENQGSLRVLQHLAAANSGGDAGHLVDLGDRYFQEGNAPLAKQTWKRILAAVQPRAKALAALGDVYLEHDLSADALLSYKEACGLEPTNLVYQKSLAAAYERTHAYREARELYESIVKKAKATGNQGLLRECRTRIVALWGLERILEAQVPLLTRRFGDPPPDVEVGKTLAEALVHLRRLGEAETTLRRVIALSPGDAESYLALERVLVKEGRVSDAIDIVGKLAELEPKRARELYQRMAQYALELYRDDDAIKFATRAVELNPDDAEGHHRLAEMFRSKQDIDRAIAEFRAAIAKNDHLFVVYFELADLLLSKGLTDDADRLFRTVVRSAPDEELVARAARLSSQINLEKGTLESLEQDLLPLAIGNPQRPIYRHLLVEIYGTLTFGLVHLVRNDGSDESEKARNALSRVGARAVKPLLDALADQDVGQQRIAIGVLAYIRNRNAALPLFAFATGPADLALRTRAMLACGALADPSLVPKYEELLFPKGTGDDPPDLADSVSAAAAWGVARLNDPRGLPLLRRIAERGAPTLRAIAVFGLGVARDVASTERIARMARSAESGTLVRAAAAHALGEMNAQTEVPLLLEMAEAPDALPRRMALFALARMAHASAKVPGWKDEAAQTMADAVFPNVGEGPRGRQTADALARAGVTALAALVKGGGDAGFWTAGDAMPLPDGAVDVESMLDGWLPQQASDTARAAALVEFAEPIKRAALAALRTSSERGEAVLDALGSGQGEFLPFVARGAAGPGVMAARSIAEALEPAILPLARHPDPTIRARALVFVSRESTDGATAAVVAGLDDPSEVVKRVALASVGASRGTGDGTGTSDGGPANTRNGRAVTAVAHILAADESWALRVLAAQALGRLGVTGANAVGPHLARAAVNDSYALVRQASLEALDSFDSTLARSVAQKMAANDPEPRVRTAAAEMAR